MRSRRSAENIVRFEQALAADGSLANLWRMNTEPRGVAFTLEFVVLANHRKVIRSEIARYAERFRAAQLEAVRRALAGSGIDEDQIPAVVALLTMTGLAQVLALESTLGVTAGHDTTVAFVERLIAQLEERASDAGTT